MGGDFDAAAFDPTAYVTGSEEPPADGGWGGDSRPVWRKRRRDTDDDLLMTVLL